MADQAVLLALSSLCGSSVRYVDLVLLSYMSRQKKVYLAVGAQALFLVRRDWTRVLTGGEILYGMIKSVVDDEASEMDLVLSLDAEELARKQNKVWIATEPITVTTINKALLLQWLEVTWCADFMLRKGRLGVFPKIVEKLSEEEQHTNQFPAVRPFINTQQ
ncbi:putative ARM repeat protein, partial [Toxoplasma gondii TgCatPRC2]